VNENDIFHGRLLRLSICGAGEGGGGCDASCENSFGDFHFLSFSSICILRYEEVIDLSD
jgi:hypothetical protein